MVKKNRERGENWTREEKDIFIQLIKQAGPILENKSTETNINKQKRLEWLRIQKQHRELSGKHREVAQLKGFWRRLKMTAQKYKALRQRRVNAIGGCQKTPSPEDEIIISICPKEFINENEFISDDFVQRYTDHDSNAISSVDECAHIYNNEMLKEIRNSRINDTIESTPTTSNLNGIYKNNNCNEENKDRTMAMIEEEHEIKMKYQKQELCHQKLRHKLEIEILMLEKEKKYLEIQKLKKLCNDH